jgi:hypothetical protein
VTAGPEPVALDGERAEDAAFEARREDAADDEGRRLRRGIVSLAILVILVGALLFAVPGLREVTERLRGVDPGWIALALVLEVLSCVGYVSAFRLVFSRVPWLLGVRVALSEMAFGAVLPAGGAGGIAIGAWIAKAKGGSLRRFMERSAVLFLLTSGVNAATLALAGLLVGVGLIPAPRPILLGLLPGPSDSPASSPSGTCRGSSRASWPTTGPGGWPAGCGRPPPSCMTRAARCSTRRGGCSARAPTCGATSRCCGWPSARSATRRRSARSRSRS